MKRFRGGLVFEAHRRFYHSTLGFRVIKQKKIRLLTDHGLAAKIGDGCRWLLDAVANDR